MHEIARRLQDGDLRLRPLAEADLAGLTDQLRNPQVSRWLAVVTPAFDARELMAHDAHPGESVRVIEQHGAVIGGLCIGSTLWYWLRPESWGQGLMRRALTLAIAARFRHPAPPLTATCHDDNAASRSLLAGLGFAPSPIRRRLFFQGSQRSEPCRDYLLAPEQWHLLHPPEIATATATLRPALQKDAPAMARLPSGTDLWPKAACLADFIESYRFRGETKGLFVITDDNRRMIGVALVNEDRIHQRFLTVSDDTRHRAGVTESLTTWAAARGEP